MPPLPFILYPRVWYAMTVHFPTQPIAHHSPIYVQQVRALKSGQGLLDLTFFHANYPEGVQDKRYRLRVLHRSSGHLVAARIEESSFDPEPLAIVLAPISPVWMKVHFEWLNVHEEPDLQQALSRRLYPSAL